MRNKLLLSLALGTLIYCHVPQVMAREGEAPTGDHGDKAKGEQGDKQGDKRTEAEKMLQAFTEHLKLTPAQQEKIKPILTDMTEQIKAAKHDKSQSEQQRGEKAMEIRKAAFDKIAEQLTPEQKAIFDKHRAGMENGGPKEKPRKEGDKSKGEYKDGQHDGQHKEGNH